MYTSPPLLLPLQKIAEQQAIHVGWKALRLSHIIEAEMSTPPGFCLTSTAFSLFLKENHLDNTIPLQEQQKVIQSRPPDSWRIPTTLLEHLEQRANSLSYPLIVRSSATIEDRANASCAGQFVSIGPVHTQDELLRAICSCWLGLWEETPLAYMTQRGVDISELSMPLLIQKFIEPQVSGILCTLNPVHCREEEMLLEVKSGGCAELTNGTTTPERYRINIYSGEISTSVHHDKRLLDKHRIRQLTELGSRIQDIYGQPQDIEWLLVDDTITILQVRPLTGLCFENIPGQWTSGNFREILPGFASPLALSLSLEYDFGRGCTEFFKDLAMGMVDESTVWGKSFFGRAYFNAQATKHFAAKVPGYKERECDISVGIDPVYDGAGQTTPFTLRTLLRAFPILLRLQSLYKSVWREGQSYRNHYLETLEPQLDQIQPSTLSDAKLAEQCHAMADLHWQANGLAIRVSMLCFQAQEDFIVVLSKTNKLLAADAQITLGDLLTGLEDIRTAQPVMDLWNLSQEGKLKPDVAQSFAAATPESMLVELNKSTAGRQFLQKVTAFITRYRYMAAVDEDIADKRWDEDSSFVMSLLWQMGRRNDSNDPVQTLNEQVRYFNRRKTECLTALAGKWHRSLLLRNFFLRGLFRVRLYTWWREENRVIASRAHYQCRRFFLELGKRWVQQGIILAKEDIFLVRWPNIMAVLDKKQTASTIRSLIDEYKRTRFAYRNFEPPNVIGNGYRAATEEQQTANKQLHGVPCSSGKVTGKVYVAERLSATQQMPPESILVARYTNPGWTPLYTLVAAIVVEEGGLLSHGAVVAREFGIPTVIAVKNVCTLLKNGDFVEVDGSKGTVTILSSA